MTIIWSYSHIGLIYNFLTAKCVDLSLIIDYSTVPFKSKLTVRCESRFSTRFVILDSCVNRESRTSYRESSQGSRLAGQKTNDSSITDFSIILLRHTAVTQHGMVIFAIHESDCMLETRPIRVIKGMFLQGRLYQASFPQVKFQMRASYANKQCIFCNVKQF